MEAFTDASLIDGHSIHSYIIYEDENVILEEQLKSNVIETTEAEIVSIIALLLKCRDLAIKNITIHTDSKAIVDMNKVFREYKSTRYKKMLRLLQKMRALMGSINANIKWIRRTENRKADKLCRDARNKIDTLEEVNLKSSGDLIMLDERVLNDNLTKGAICAGTVSEEEEEHINRYYCSMVLKSCRRSTEELLMWGESQSHRNSQKGRRFFVESFIIEFHHSYELNQLKIQHAFTSH